MELREVFEPVMNFLRNLQKKDKEATSKEKAKERLQLVLMQDRASVSPDFFEMMKKELIEVIKKYIEIDEEALEVQLTRGFEDGDTGPALFANIPIKNIKPVAKKLEEKVEEYEAKENEETKVKDIVEEDQPVVEESKENAGKENPSEETNAQEVESKVSEENIAEENKEIIGTEKKVENGVNKTEEKKKDTPKKESKKKTQSKKTTKK